MMQRYSDEFLDVLIVQACRSPRRRQHHNLHMSYAEPVQRLFNAIGVDSYIRPHRHTLDPKLETLVALRGRFALIVFDDDGGVRDCIAFGIVPGDDALVEVPPEHWHSVVAISEGAVLLEIKEGPFDPEQAKEPAPWSPEEGADSAVGYLAGLRATAIEHISRKRA